MEDQGQDHGSERSERVTVRSRWTPKPEQILVLESIFNSGTVNPSKDDTVRIRKLLEKFGTVADANIFYWFQNRRSRSRRRQRQMQQLAAEALHQANHHQPQPQQVGGASATPSPYDDDHHHHHQSNPASDSAAMACYNSAAMAGYNGGCSSSYLASQGPVDAFFFSADHMGFPEIDLTSDLNFHSGYITVFINGVATEVPSGPIDMKTVFGEGVILVHSSGVPVPTNEFGFIAQGLQHGETYFLVLKAT